jgi:hypothetical protein
MGSTQTSIRIKKTTKAVSKHAERQPDQGAGKDGRRRQQTKFCFAELKQHLDGYAQYREHHPDHETQRKGQGTHP